jgi:RHS repeat-associated protein
VGATVKSRHDYLPFGEEIGGTQVGLKGGRSAGQMYVTGSLRQKFTGQERDAESGLDYFLARCYASGQGRFTSVDPLRD